MPQNVPNQKAVVIHRDISNANFLQIKNENWMEFNKKHGPFALQLYLYFAKNPDGVQITLSQQAAQDEVGIAKTTFHKYVLLLIAEGYLVHRDGNTYDFYETPHKQEDKKIEGTPCGKSHNSLAEQQSLSSKSGSSPHDATPPQTDEEIANLADIIDKE